VRYSLRHYVGAEVAGVTVHVDGLRYQPNALERADSIERTESIERPEPTNDKPKNLTATEGETAPGNRKPR
jgi:hypothetical protein